MSAEPRRRPSRGRRGHRWLSLYALLVYAFLSLPLAVVVVASFGASDLLQFPPDDFSLRWYRSFIASDELLDAFFLSFRIAAIVTTASLVIGIPAALVLVRHRLVRGVPALQGLFVAPLIVPYVILAIGLYFVNLKLNLRGSITSIVIAHTVISLPFVILLISAGLFSVPKALEEAGRGLGGNSLRVFRRVTLPLITPSILGAAVFVFIVSWDEFILAYLLSAPGVETLPVMIFNLLRERVDPTISAVSTVLMAITLLSVVAWEQVRRLAGRRAIGS